MHQKNLPARRAMAMLISVLAAGALPQAAQASHIGEDLTTEQQAMAASNELVTALRQYENMPAAQRDAMVQRLTQLAAARKARMLALIERNPRLAAMRMMPAAVRDRLPPQAQALVERDVALSGAIQASVADDMARGVSQQRLFIRGAGGQPYVLKVVGASEREQLAWVGKRATVVASQFDAQLLVKDKQQVQLLAADGTATTTATTTTTLAAAGPTVQGVQKTLVVMIDFNDKPLECGAADLQNRLFGTSGSTLDQGYRQSSNGLVSFNGQVVGPFRINYSSTGPTCDFNNWAAAAGAAAKAAGFDPATYMRVSYALPSTSVCSWTGLADLGGTPPTQSWVQSCGSTGVFSHEIGHNLNFHHAATLASEYGDYTDPMGGAMVVQSNAANRVMAGWLTGATRDVTTAGTYALAAMSSGNTSAPQVLRVAKPDTGEWYYLSMRQAIGVDANLPSSLRNTLLIYRASGTLPAKTYLLASVAAGQVWSDTVNGYQFSHLGVAGDTATVGVNASGAVCTRSAPSVTVSPASQGTVPGGSLGYSLQLTNNNSPACQATTFTLQQALPAGFVGSLPTASTLLASGASASITWTVSPGTGTADGVYTLDAAAADAAAPTSSAVGHAGLTVTAPTVAPPPPPPPTTVADTTPPTVLITFPTANATVSGRSIPLSANVTDTGGVASVSFYVDGKLIGTDTAAPFAASWNARKSGLGTHQVRVRAVDAAGNAAEQTISVTLVK